MNLFLFNLTFDFFKTFLVLLNFILQTRQMLSRTAFFTTDKIIESGSHSELMAKGGTYAYMFNLQAEKYRDNQ